MAEMIGGAVIMMVGFTLGVVFMLMVSAARSNDDG